MLFDKQLLTAVRTAAARYGISKTDVLPSILYVYSKLTATQNVVKFIIDETTKILPNNEQILNRNNVHFTTHLGLAIHQVISSKPANTPLDFYPDKTKYAGATGAEAKNLEQMYNAKLFVKTDSDIRLEGLKTNIFRSVPFTQSATSTHPSSGELALIDVGTVFPFIGGAVNQAWLDIDDKSDFANMAGVAGTSENYGVLICAGIEVRNGAKNTEFVNWLKQLSQGEISY